MDFMDKMKKINEENERLKSEKRKAKFQKKENKKLKKVENYRQNQESLVLREKEELDKFNGKYVAIDFHSQDWSNTDSMIISKVYKRIAEYANRHELDIVNISRIEDGALKTVTVSVIFKRSN